MFVTLGSVLPNDDSTYDITFNPYTGTKSLFAFAFSLVGTIGLGLVTCRKKQKEKIVRKNLSVQNFQT